MIFNSQALVSFLEALWRIYIYYMCMCVCVCVCVCVYPYSFISLWLYRLLPTRLFCHSILWTRILGWVAISFSKLNIQNAFKITVKISLSANSVNCVISRLVLVDKFLFAVTFPSPYLPVIYDCTKNIVFILCLVCDSFTFL